MVSMSAEINRDSTRKDKLMKHCGTQKLETDRLVLRRYVNEDAASLVVGMTLSSAATMMMAISVTCAPRARMAVNAS